VAIVLKGDVDWTGDMTLILEALDGGPTADPAGYDFESSGAYEYEATIPEPVDPEDRLTGLYRATCEAGVFYVNILADSDSLRMSSFFTEPEISLSGPGADFVTISIKDNGVGVAYANVWITSDANGSTVIAGTSATNSSGTVRFLLNDGTTYYLWAQKDGMQSINGRSFVAVRDV
jgi:hypothetical protein